MGNKKKEVAIEVFAWLLAFAIFFLIFKFIKLIMC